MEEGWEQQAVCVLSPLLHKACWTSFWQVSDNVNPGSVNPGNGELQKLKQQIYTKKNCNPYKNTLRNTSPFLNSSLTAGRVLGKREPLLPARNDDPS